LLLSAKRPLAFRAEIVAVLALVNSQVFRHLLRSPDLPAHDDRIEQALPE
jgi:hypothetical protein